MDSSSSVARAVDRTGGTVHGFTAFRRTQYGFTVWSPKSGLLGVPNGQTTPSCWRESQTCSAFVSFATEPRSMSLLMDILLLKVALRATGWWPCADSLRRQEMSIARTEISFRRVRHRISLCSHLAPRYCEDSRYEGI